MTVMTVLRDRMLATGGALLVATHDEELAALLRRSASIDEGRLSQGVSA
jgi:ABC-type lipoprotein export system ATPase subunit